MAALLLASGLMVALIATEPKTCTTTRELVAQTRGQMARVTVIEDRAELQKALDFMFRNSDGAPPPAESLVVIERSTDAEIVMFREGCATIKAMSSPDLTARMLQAVRPEEGFI